MIYSTMYKIKNSYSIVEITTKCCLDDNRIQVLNTLFTLASLNVIDLDWYGMKIPARVI